MSERPRCFGKQFDIALPCDNCGVACVWMDDCQKATFARDGQKSPADRGWRGQ